MLGLILCLLAASSLQPRPARAGSFPAAATGDIWFLADHAGFRSDDGAAVEEYYVRVPNNQLDFEPAEAEGVAHYEGRVFLRLTFRDADGDELGEASKEYRFRAVDQAAAISADRVQLLVLREPLHPRTAEVEIKLEDLNARKRGLIYLITKKRREGQAQARLIPPPFEGQQFGLSDLQFAWSVEPGTEASLFAKHGFNVVPNPGRAYGLYRDSLTTYFEVYDTQPARGGTYVATVEVRDSQGRVLAAGSDTVAAPGGEWAHVKSVPVKALPAGTFDLVVQVREFGGDRVASATRPFNVVWSESSWGRSEQDVLDEARILLPEADYERFKEMQSGDRETYLAAFWAAHDPSGNTARNEIREIFQQRVDHANRNFSTAYEKGMISDRGRIYIRYGEPDEVTREVMPQIGSSLSDVLAGKDQDRPELSRLRAGNANVVDTRPYEIWSYTRQGEPLFRERERTTPNTGLTFIFVDEQGFGNYVMKYASSFQRY